MWGTRSTRYLLTSLLLAAGTAVSACSSDSNDDGGNGNCSVTLSGAVTSTLTCTGAGVVAAYTTATNQSAIAVLTTSQTFALSIEFTGTLHTGALHSTDTGAAGGITFSEGTSSWFTTPGTGTYTVNLTTVNTLSTTGTGTVYTVHGTIDGTLPPTSGTGASVTLHATF